MAACMLLLPCCNSGLGLAHCSRSIGKLTFKVKQSSLLAAVNGDCQADDGAIVHLVLGGHRSHLTQALLLAEVHQHIANGMGSIFLHKHE